MYELSAVNVAHVTSNTTSEIEFALTHTFRLTSKGLDHIMAHVLQRNLTTLWLMFLEETGLYYDPCSSKRLGPIEACVL